jgi:hypothetical protein
MPVTEARQDFPQQLPIVQEIAAAVLTEIGTQKFVEEEAVGQGLKVKMDKAVPVL